MPDCPTLVGDAAIGMVETAYGQYSAFAMEAFQTAQDAMVALGNVDITPIAFGVSFNVDGNLLGYRRPTAPTTPDMAQREIDAPPLPPDMSVPDVDFDTAPQFGGTIPALVFPAPPSEAMPTEPGPGPVITTPAFPDSPVLDYPTVPTLLELQIPDAPSLNLPEFAGIRPDTNIAAPTNNFSFQASAYSSDLLMLVGDKLSDMLNGNVGLPGSMLLAMRERAFAQLDVEESMGRQQAIEQFASRGFTEPNGILNSRLRAVRQDAQNRRASTNRDIYIQDQTAAREDRNLAIAQAVALEGQLYQLHNDSMRLGLAVAQAQLQADIDITNVRIAVLGAQVAAYQTDAQVFRDLIQAELAELEIYKAQLDGQRLRGELNTQMVAIYEQRIRAVLARVEVFKAENDAVKTQVEAQGLLIEAHRTDVQAYAERVRARTAVFDGYRSRIDAETAKVTAAQIVADIFGKRMQGWSVEQESKGRQQQIRIQQKQGELEGWKGRVDLFRAMGQQESDRVRNLASIFDTLMRKYLADANIEQVASDSNARQFQLKLEEARGKVDTQLKSAEIAINQMVQLSAQLIETQKSIAQVSAQLASASMSAVNFSAGVSSSRGQSQSCNTTISYEPDA